MVTLVALRLAIGWHFYQEGVTKIHEPGWTAAGFFTGSKGPLKPLFESMVWDGDGRARLNYAPTETGRPTIDVRQTLQVWEQHVARVEEHYGFDAAQKKKAQRCLKDWEGRLRWYFSENEADILKYFNGLDRRATNRADEARQEVESLRGQANKVESELASDRAPWLTGVMKIWNGFDQDLNKLATADQRAASGRMALGKPGRKLLDTNLIDAIIPYFDTIVGVMLIFGLGTRLAALAGAGFLFSICLTQWPGAPGAAPIYYQAIEMLALLVLVAMAAGQYAGLDFIIHNFRAWKKSPEQETNS